MCNMPISWICLQQKTFAPESQIQYKRLVGLSQDEHEMQRYV